MIPVSRPYTDDDECEAVTRVIRSKWLSSGVEAKAFEKELEQRFGCYALCVGSGSIGLELALAAHGIGPGAEVIVPAITFVATSNVVLHLGATVVFADIDPKTGLMDFEDAKRRVTSKTRAIMPVDLYGQRVDFTPYVDFARTHSNISVIEDAAHAFGTSGVGGIGGVTTVYSFYATKNIAMGEGGAVLTKSEVIAKRVRILSQQGVTADAYSRYNGMANYDVVEIGYKGNLPDLLAAVGRAQLRKEKFMLDWRERVCRRYQAELRVRSIDWKLPTNYHLFPMFCRDRDRFRMELAKRGVGTGVHYACIPGLTAYRTLGYNAEDTPVSMEFGAEEVSLPTYAGLSDEELSLVIGTVQNCYEECDKAPSQI